MRHVGEGSFTNLFQALDKRGHRERSLRDNLAKHCSQLVARRDLLARLDRQDQSGSNQLAEAAPRYAPPPPLP